MSDHGWFKVPGHRLRELREAEAERDRLRHEVALNMRWITGLRRERDRYHKALEQIEDVTTNERDAVEAATRASHIAHDALASEEKQS